MTKFKLADLFCGAGGTSTGAVEAITLLGEVPELTAINHWPVAVATHTANHPTARHLCASLDSLNPRDLFKADELRLLWASPECTHHSQARGGKPIHDQSRATAWCVARWAEALRPVTILVENVPEFETWGPLGSNGRPLASRKGEVFQSWLANLRAIGYTVDHRVLCAANYGDPTTRRRLFIQCQRGRRKIVWPDATHRESDDDDMFSNDLLPWVPAKKIINWSKQGQSIYDRKRPLSPKTLARIYAGLRKFGLKPFITPGMGERAMQTPRTHDVDAPLPTVAATGHTHLVEPFIITMEHRGSLSSASRPLPTITTAKRGAIGMAQPFLVNLHGTGTVNSVDQPTPAVAASGGHFGLAEPFLIHTAHSGERTARSIDQPMPTVAGNRGDVGVCEPHLLPQHAGSDSRPVTLPVPTVTTDGAIAVVEPFLIEYYGNGRPQSVSDPLGTATTKQRFGLVRPEVVVDGKRYLLDIRFRMLQPEELALAQGFRSDYKFTGNKTEMVKQIGNAVPRRLARAICLAAVGQSSNISIYTKRPLAKAS